MGSASPVLIFRPGSFGDHLVSLPCLHRIAQAFPDRERILLTNPPCHPKAPAASDIFGSSGLVHRVLELPAPSSRSRFDRARLVRQIRSLQGGTVVYLNTSRTFGQAFWHRTAFSLCGIRQAFGFEAPLRIITGIGHVESEAQWLTRSIAALGPTDLSQPGNWDLLLTAEEIRSADDLFGISNPEKSPKPDRFAMSISSSTPSKDWPYERWAAVLDHLSRLGLAECNSGPGLLLLGADQDHAMSEQVRQHWRGPSQNLCGLASPRQSAALLDRCRLFLGVDSAPMHLAAACNVPCVAVFSAHRPPGMWFPHGTHHRILYPASRQCDCGEGRPSLPAQGPCACLLSIPVEAVVNAFLETYERTTGGLRHRQAFC